ncbi:MAG: tRNA preQ1(34) S-adenosylmethionine ribosyltransferase-isomerase QueA [Candidatus Gracilibacteria bacterium]
MDMNINDFNYALPKELIAQTPLPMRSDARLMVLDQKKQTITHRHIRDLPEILTPNDVLVFNETKVFPARVKGLIDGKEVEILLHKEITPDTWECLTKPGKRFSLETTIIFDKNLTATVKKIQTDGSRILVFSKSGPELQSVIDQIGETPLPPYIHQPGNLFTQEYQTVYAKNRGSVAAPTAGLHFTQDLLKKLKEKEVEQHFVTLHVGRGTFEPVKVENIADHVMHHEWLELTPQTAAALNTLKTQGKRIFAIGTTSCRVLESCAKNNFLTPQTKETNLFITPGYSFQFIDGLLTNFHLPKSTLLMLVSALAGKDFMFKAYQEAIRLKYRFFSFGDAMLIV